MVHRRERGSNVSRLIDAPQAQQDYMKYFNAVDCNDRDSADYLTFICTNHYYLHIFCWILDRVNRVLYVVVCYLANSGIRESKWGRHLKKEFGRHDFQIDLSMALLNRAIEWDWDGTSKKPGWMRQSPVLPCNCATVISVFSVSRVSPAASHIHLRRSRRSLWRTSGEQG
jgi:hypothetical protein